MSPNPSEGNYRRRRARVRADHDDVPLRQPTEQGAEQQAENAEQQFSEHAALGAQMSAGGSTDAQAGAVATADPGAKAALVTSLQQQHGNQHVQRVVQRLRVQRYPNKTPDAKDDTETKTATPSLIDAITAKAPHIAKVLKPEQIAQWQKLVDAGAKWREIQQEKRKASGGIYFDRDGHAVGGATTDLNRYNRIADKADAQAVIMSQNRYLDVPTELLLDADVLKPNLTAGPDEAAIFAFHQRLYDRLVSTSTRVWLDNVVVTVEDLQQALWPIHIANPVFESELGSEGGLIRWQSLMKASQSLALRYQQTLLEAQAKVTGKMADISSTTYAYAATDKMRSDVFTIRRLLGNMHVSDSEEAQMLAIVRKWSEIDAKSDDATKHGMGVSYNRHSDTPQYDEFIGMLRTTSYNFSSFGTVWTDQTSNVFDGLWEELEGSHVQEYKDLLARSKMWAGSGRMFKKMESAWSYVGKREAMGGLGIVNALGRGLTGLVDLGLWAGYRMGGGEGDAPAITPWLAKQQEKEAGALAGALGLNLKEEKGLFGMDPYHFASTFGMIPAALMTAGAMAPLGEAGALISGAQTLKAADDLADKIKKMREAGKSWSDIFSDPYTWAQVVAVVAGAIGTAGGMAQAGSAAKETLNQLGIVANVGQMELIAAAYMAVDDDPSIKQAEKNQRKADLLAEFLSTGTMTIDQKYGEAFKQRWEGRYAQGVAEASERQQLMPAGEPEPTATAKPGESPGGASGPGGSSGSKGAKEEPAPSKTTGAKDSTTDHATPADDHVKSPEPGTETQAGGQAYYGKRPPPVPLNKKGFNQPVGEPLHSLEQGRSVMRRLKEGDAGALVDIGVKLPENYNPLGREWGLGKTKDGKFIIIEGGTGGVDWNVLISHGIEPVSHSHPLFKGREMTQPGVTIPELINGVNMADKVHVMVSVSDVAFCAGNKLGWHEVQIPYAHLGDGRIGNWTGNEPGLSIIIHDARLMGESPQMYYYKSTLEFVSNGQTVWKGEVWGWSNFAQGAGNFSTTQPEHFSQATPAPEPTAVPTVTPAGVHDDPRPGVQLVPGQRLPATVHWDKKLSSGGNAGSLGNHPGQGVFEGQIPGMSEPVAIKVYPASQNVEFMVDMLGAQVASQTGMAAVFYGEVDAGPGKRAFAMEKVKGGVSQDESTDTASLKDKQEAQKEAAFYADKIGPQTKADVQEYGNRLLDRGFYAGGEVQGLISATGRWTAIDFQTIRRLPDPNQNPKAYQEALTEHQKNIDMEIKALKDTQSNPDKKP